MKIALAQINPIVGSLKYNQQKILSSVKQAKKNQVDLIVFPELALCGYPPEDLLLLPAFVSAVQEHLTPIIEASSGIAVVVGTIRENPTAAEKPLLNTAAVIENGELLGFQDKLLLPDYDVFSERRYFEPGKNARLWSLKQQKVAVTICEDIWQHSKAIDYTCYQKDPVAELKKEKPALLINLSASPFYHGRPQTRLKICSKAAKTLHCPVVLCNQVGGNDSLIFDGSSIAVDSKGLSISTGHSFQEDLVVFDISKDTPSTPSFAHPTEDLYNALVLGIRDYFNKLGFQKACLGLSGGIDSAVVACLAKEALGAEHVLPLMMPSRYSSKGSLDDALALVKNLSLPCKELSIEPCFKSFLETLTPHFDDLPSDITEENLQARIRGTLLMAFSNKLGYLVLSTGNKSEMAMGYSTLYGDMCGGLAVLNDVTKGEVYALAHYINQQKPIIPPSTIEKSPSAELRFDQKDSDSLPEYDVVDTVLKGYVEENLSPSQIAQKNNIPLPLVTSLIKKIHKNEYKRRQSPPGLRVSKKAFSKGRRFPIVQKWV